MGVPAIVSASGGNIDIVRDNVTGAHFTPDSGESLSRRLEDILHGNLRPAPPEAIRASVADRSARVVADQYTRIYREMLASPAPAA